MIITTGGAIAWDKKQVCVEEALVLDKAKMKKQKLRIDFYKHFNQIWLTIVFVICALSTTYMLTINHGIISITVCVFVIVTTLLSIPFFCKSKEELDDKIKEEEKKVYVLTDDFLFFAHNVYPANRSLGGINWVLDYTHQDFFTFNTKYFNEHMMYKLFVVVNTYAMDSFIAAATNEDYIAMRRLLFPFIDKIVEDTKKAYRTHLELEEYLDDSRNADLNAQIDLDLAIFEKHNK